MRGKCQGAGGRLGNAWWAGDSQKTKTFQLHSAVHGNLLFILFHKKIKLGSLKPSDDQRMTGL